MSTESNPYVEPPTIPPGMTCQEYRRVRSSGTRSRRLHRRVTARLRRELRA